MNLSLFFINIFVTVYEYDKRENYFDTFNIHKYPHKNVIRQNDRILF